jgi:hypothetical protein
MSDELRRCWSRSRTYRVILVAVLIFTLLRLVVQGLYLGMMLFPELRIFGGTPAWVGNDGGMVPADLQIYLDAAEHFKHREGLYLQGSLSHLEDHYPYSPFFAFLFRPFLWFSPGIVTLIHTLLHIIAYGWLYVRWGHIFEHLRLSGAKTMLAWTLPVWLLFTDFWSDLAYLNIYLLIALIGTFYIESVIREKLGASVVWLSLIVQIKPHWAFAAAVPLILGRYRFFLKMIGLATVAYVAVIGGLMVVAGPAYIASQYADYISFLGRLSRDFPWRGPDAPFLGYNHSIKQIAIYLFGSGPKIIRWANVGKVLLLAPLGWVCLRHGLHPVNKPGDEMPVLSLDVAFALYLGAFIWLDMVWEVSLGIAIFSYLLATTERGNLRTLIWAVFLPYTLIDVVRTISFAVWGLEVVAPGPYVLTDPSLYVPLVMIVILVFYALLIVRLQQSAAFVNEER